MNANISINRFYIWKNTCGWVYIVWSQLKNLHKWIIFIYLNFSINLGKKNKKSKNQSNAYLRHNLLTEQQIGGSEIPFDHYF
jgi:hypothetical protein